MAEEKKHEKTEHHKEEKKKKLPKLDTWQTISIILVLLLLFSIFTNGFRINLGKDKVGKDVVDYLNTYILAGQGIQAELVDVSEENGLYKLKLDVGGREFDSYVTKNGNLLFPSVIDLSETPDMTQIEQTPQEIPKTDKPDVKLFVMSFCPYGISSLQAMAPVVELIKDVVKVNYVIYTNYQGGSDDYCVEEGKYCSMHGIQELNEDVRQMCIQKYQKDKFWDYALAVSEECNYQNVDVCWDAVAKSNNVDVVKVKSCFDKEKVSLLKAEFELNQKNGVSGSPTLIINDVQYSGQRTSEAFRDAICSAYNKEPSACAEEIKTTGQATTTTTGGCG